jgi:hypothetical protein
MRATTTPVNVTVPIFTKSISYGSLPVGSQTPIAFLMDWSANKEKSILAVWLDYDYENITKEKGEKLVVCQVSGGGTVKVEQFLGPEISEMRQRVEKAQFVTDL